MLLSYNQPSASSTKNIFLEKLQGLLLGMVPPSSTTFQGGPLSLPSAALDSQHVFQQQSLLEQLVRTQPNNSGVLTRSIQEVLNSIYSPQSAMSTNRKETDGLATANMRIPSTTGSGDSGISNESTMLQGPSNSDVIATFLARQQHNRNISKYLNNNNNNFSSNLAVRDSAALPMRNALPAPVNVASTDTTQQLLQLLQNRQMNSTSNINISQIEALLQQQLQQKPHGR